VLEVLAATSPRAPAEAFTLLSYDIAENWRWIELFLQRVKRPDWTLGNVRTELEAARAQLWGMREGDRPLGIWITRIEGSRGLLWIAAGERLEEGLGLFNEHTVPWLKSKGCKYVQIIGRHGWKRVLPDYEDVGIVLEKEL
jgi:hypothetical protein